MGFADRPYYGRNTGYGGGGGGDFFQKLLRFMNWTFPIGRYLGTSVHVHITFLFLLVYYLAKSPDWMWTLRWQSLLFVSVLLHEFGHILGCRSVGGHADQILMWPLGGLASCDPPQRPWGHFVTVLCGPLVNVVLAGGAYAALLVYLGNEIPVSLNPLKLGVSTPLPGLWGMVAALFTVNYSLLLFNLALAFYPFDGGRLVQIALWCFIGLHRSLMVATAVGMVGAVGTFFFAMAYNIPMLTGIAIFGFIACYQQRQAVRSGAYAESSTYAAAFEPYHAHRKQGFFARWRQRSASRKFEQRRRNEERMEAEVDRILEKVSRQGLHSLTRKEKKILKEATERQRQD